MIISVEDTSNIICAFRTFVIAESISIFYDNIFTLSQHTSELNGLDIMLSWQLINTGGIAIITGSQKAKLYSFTYACG